MFRFWNTFTHPLFLRLEPRVIVEVGSFQGHHTELLLEYCLHHDATLHAIDPKPLFDVAAWQAKYGSHFVMHEAKSLDVLSTMESADIVLVDGDHNWYTVYHELKQLALAAHNQQHHFPIVMFHDIGWPYARRDLYYNPADIPEAFRQPFQINGIVPGMDKLRRFGFNYNLANAINEGGPRNGVLTAVEDFMAESDERLELLLIDGFHGIGILYPMSICDGSPALRMHFDDLKTMRRIAGELLTALEAERVNLHVNSFRLTRQLAKSFKGQTFADERAG